MIVFVDPKFETSVVNIELIPNSLSFITLKFIVQRCVKEAIKKTIFFDFPKKWVKFTKTREEPRVQKTPCCEISMLLGQYWTVPFNC